MVKATLAIRTNYFCNLKQLDKKKIKKNQTMYGSPLLVFWTKFNSMPALNVRFVRVSSNVKVNNSIPITSDSCSALGTMDRGVR